MTLGFLERGSMNELKGLAELRCVAREAIQMASAAGVLRRLFRMLGTLRQQIGLRYGRELGKLRPCRPRRPSQALRNGPRYGLSLPR